MPTQFYVEGAGGVIVAAQFLQYNSQFVHDPNVSNAQNTIITDQYGNVIQNANPNGYLIVPTNYSVSNAVNAAQSVQDAMQAGGVEAGIGTMTALFAYGPQDLQRNYNGQTDAPFVGGFTDAASFNLGLITQQSGLPLVAAQVGGGMLMMIDGEEQAVTPGMAVTAEIKTGRRSVISYLLSPLRRYAHEGMRER